MDKSLLAVCFVACSFACTPMDPDAIGATDRPSFLAAPECSQSKIQEVVSPARDGAESVIIDCSMRVPSGAVISKRLYFEGTAASNVLFACAPDAVIDGTVRHGTDYIPDMIEVRSKKIDTTQWVRPENVTIEDCHIKGAVRIWGMAKNGQGADLKASSLRAGHTARTRAAAPTGTKLRRLRITAFGRTPLYIGPGSTHTLLEDSEIDGVADGVAMYLDAESAYGTFKGNTIHADRTVDRELIAIDGSAHNRLLRNRFSALHRGGIFIYRNCGEGGTIRHATPQYNEIINNVFYYNSYSGSDPAVLLNSRNGSHHRCPEDNGYPYGSSADNRDFARYNVIAQNQIVKRSVSDMIKNKDARNHPNIIVANQTVTSPVSRESGCYVEEAYSTQFLRHNEFVHLFRDAFDEPSCNDVGYICRDGELANRAQSDACQVLETPFGCHRSLSANGCSDVASCPSDSRLIGLKAACNLELGRISDAQLDGVRGGTVRVVRPSDRVSDGLCQVAGVSIREGTASVSVPSSGTVDSSCREKDSTGGDCEVRGLMYCVR